MSRQHRGQVIEEPNPLDLTGLCLLSLDGGGIRGLSTLYIIRRIMARLNGRRRRFGQPPVKPCDVFDVIGGTSTGGLIAIMLGRLEMDIDECMRAYVNFAGMSFRDAVDTSALEGDVRPRFHSTHLHNAAVALVKHNGISEQTLLNDGSERKCKTFVCAVDSSTKHLVRLRDYSLEDEISIAVTVQDAICATFAATTFFEPVKIGNRTFCSGILGANNPAQEIEEEASNIWCPSKSGVIDIVKCFLSVGTGNPGSQPFSNIMSEYLNKDLFDLVAETERTEKSCAARWAELLDDKRYFRFNVEQGLQDVGLYEYNAEKRGLIEGATESYLLHQAQKFNTRDCVLNLHQKLKIIHCQIFGTC
ncbi:phospholipase, patatin family protein [Myriangium duriaei CBS 260.36]|uniref:Phospholipase, patatin family protein n=1 Tax=Myriangium duriaei CBS 260.36 TaxID=1168546 RepID=A0A9P4IVM4_9PEZI|nr:phospholipase, patatin family protein [Myriangium duriaei CBS 260.36]